MLSNPISIPDATRLILNNTYVMDRQTMELRQWFYFVGDNVLTIMPWWCFLMSMKRRDE